MEGLRYVARLGHIDNTIAIMKLTPHTLPPDTICCRLEGPLGTMLAAATARGLAGLWFEDGQRDTPPPDVCASWCLVGAGNSPLFALLQTQLTAYFATPDNHPAPAFDIPLDLTHGSAWQQAVWQALCRLAPGQITSYGALASALGRPTAARAVGTAVGSNPIGIIVPCHRVLGRDGSLTGYAGGLSRKIALLRLEGVPGFEGTLL